MSAYALMHDPIRITITPSGTKAGVVNSHAGSAELKPTASTLVYFQPCITTSLVIILRLSEPIHCPSCSALCHAEMGFMDVVCIFMSLSEEICTCLYVCVLEFIEQVFPVLIIGETDAACYYRDFLITRKQMLQDYRLWRKFILFNHYKTCIPGSGF